MNSLITHNQQISILVLLSRVKEWAFSISLQYVPSVPPRKLHSEIEWRPVSRNFHFTQLTWGGGNNFCKCETIHDTEQMVRVDTHCFPCSAAITKRHGTGKLRRRMTRDASLLSTTYHLTPLPISEQRSCEGLHTRISGSVRLQES